MSLAGVAERDGDLREVVAVHRHRSRGLLEADPPGHLLGADAQRR